MSTFDVSDITSSTLTAGVTQLPENKSNTLGKEDFLNLLVTQMKNQDPLSPMDNKDLVLQLSQLSTLEGTQNLNDSMKSFINTSSLSTASGMIGKDVVYADTVTGNSVIGNVEAVKVVGGTNTLIVGGAEVALSQVKYVYTPATTPTTTTN